MEFSICKGCKYHRNDGYCTYEGGHDGKCSHFNLQEGREKEYGKAPGT